MLPWGVHPMDRVDPCTDRYSLPDYLPVNRHIPFVLLPGLSLGRFLDTSEEVPRRTPQTTICNLGFGILNWSIYAKQTAIAAQLMSQFNAKQTTICNLGFGILNWSIYAKQTAIAAQLMSQFNAKQTTPPPLV